MRIGIIGLPQTGKKTLFALLAGEEALKKHFDPRKPHGAVVEVQDPRFDDLVRMLSPEKDVRSRLEITLIPSMEEPSISQGEIFKEMEEVDAFCHVVRDFDDPGIYHMHETIDPGRDIEYLNNELLLHDLLFVEKRLERIEKDLKKLKDDHEAKEKDLLLRMRKHLEDEKPLRFMELSNDEVGIVASYPFLTRKQMIVVLNVSEADIGDEDKFKGLSTDFQKLKIEILPIALKAESEIASLESEEDRKEFMKAAGIKETALETLTRGCINVLGLVSFFTIRSNEVRQWFIKRGATALDAARTIHTDLERGFIRAEVIKYEDLNAFGSEAKVKAAGKMHLKGRDYIVEDGDILGIRFSL